MKLSDNKGSILIIAYMTLYVLATLSVGIALANFTELNFARRYSHSTTAFWLAEAGISMFMKDPTMLDSHSPETIDYGGGTILLSKDDSQPLVRAITSAGKFAGLQRKIQITYPANIPEVFKNALSTAGNIIVNGNKSAFIINDKGRLSGKFVNNSKYPTIYFEDLQESVDPSLTTITYPDANDNGKADELVDFTEFNRNLVSSYPPSQVVYLKDQGTFTLTPESSLGGKKIIYVEGGDVVIQFNNVVKENQNLTIIATGTVTFNQTGDQPANSQLNIISWEGYQETAALPSTHKGLIYTHGVAKFDHIYDTSTTSGGLVANGGVEIGEVWSTKTINYANTRVNGIFPPGFEGLKMQSSAGVAVNPSSWKEI